MAELVQLVAKSCFASSFRSCPDLGLANSRADFTELETPRLRTANPPKTDIIRRFSAVLLAVNEACPVFVHDLHRASNPVGTTFWASGVSLSVGRMDDDQHAFACNI